MTQPVTLDRIRWTTLWSRLGARGSGQATLDHLATAYADPLRAYHNAQHIRDCLSELDRSRTLAVRADEVELALWFHDAVYIPGNPDNELRSARLAQTALAADAVAFGISNRVAALVLATQHLVPSEDPDVQLVCDIDLSVLGKEAGEFEEFERRIRQEYHWVPDPVYRRSRAAVLSGFLQRRSIYQTAPFVEEYELRARQNLERVLVSLAG